jgi:hypothetical protein
MYQLAIEGLLTLGFLDVLEYLGMVELLGACGKCLQATE